MMIHTSSQGLLLKRFTIFALLTWTVGASLSAGDESSKASEAVVLKFRQLDKDANRSLSVNEFVAGREPVEPLRRDFRLFDFDADGKLTLEEYLPIANGVEFPTRGPIPDPAQKWVDQAVAALDKNLNNWNERLNEEIDAVQFIRMVNSRPQNPLPDTAVGDVDTNRDGQVSRAEARRFIEMQFGVRRSDGELLREPNGAINDYITFMKLDINNNDRLERSEYLVRANRGDKEAVEFETADRDLSGDLSFAEWRALEWTFQDPIAEFRRMDTNFDAFLDAEELTRNSVEVKKRISKRLIPAFDSDGDHKLSLDEFRLCPYSNPILIWTKYLRDRDHDHKLSLTEFAFDKPLFPWLRSVYFRRFDRNSDGFLDSEEYDFKVGSAAAIFSVNENGTDRMQVVLGQIKYGALGSISVSPDGEWLAFDGVEHDAGHDSPRKILVVPYAGGEVQAICTGMMPSWSADSSKIVCSLTSPQGGPWILKLDEDDSTYVGPSWGAEWSPDGTKIYSNSGNVMQVYHVRNGVTETVLEATEHEYQSFEWNAAWSPDSKRLCVKATKANGENDIAIVNFAAKGKDKVKSRYTAKEIRGDFAWHPSGHRIVASLFNDQENRWMVYEFDPDTDDAPKPMTGAFENCRNGFAWTPDGKRLLFCGSED